MSRWVIYTVRVGELTRTVCPVCVAQTTKKLPAAVMLLQIIGVG